MAMVRVMSGIVESEKLASKSSGSESSRAEVDGPRVLSSRKCPLPDLRHDSQHSATCGSRSTRGDHWPPSATSVICRGRPPSA